MGSYETFQKLIV